MLAGLRPRLGVVVPGDSTGEVDAESVVDAVVAVEVDSESVVLTESEPLPEELVVGDDFSDAVFTKFGSEAEAVEDIGAGEGDREVFHGLRVRFAKDDLEKVLRVRSADTLGAAVTSTLGLAFARVLSAVGLVLVTVAVLVVEVGVVVVVVVVVVLLLFLELRPGRLPAFSLNEACRRILLPVSTSIGCTGDCASAEY